MISNASVKPFDKYQKLSLIGKSANSKVYLVQLKDTEQLFVIKRIELYSPACMQEMRILRMLNHPNVIKIHEYFDDIQRLYLVLEKAQCWLTRRSQAATGRRRPFHRGAGLLSPRATGTRAEVHPHAEGDPP